MDIKMLSSFMISRFLRRSLVGLLVPLGLFALSCERVPLFAPAGSIITLTSTTTSLAENGTTRLVVQVIEASGTPPHSGTHITFTTTLGFVVPSEVQTDVSGRAEAIFNAGTGNGTAVITASSGGSSASGVSALRIAIGAAAVGRVTIDANPTTVSVSGGQSTITSFVFDGNGNPLGGVAVTFTTTAGSVSPSVVSADQNGRSQATLTTTRTATVTASAGISGSTGGGGATGGTGGTGGTGSTGGSTSSSQSATTTVTVNTAATITVGTVTPATPAVNQPVSIPLTYNPTGVIVRLNVDWGDGQIQSFTGSPASISHTYRNPLAYLVTITGFDSFGDAATASAAITVSPQPRPTVNISSSPNPTAGSTTTFTISATPPTGQVITSVNVDFGDGQQVTLNGNATSVQHVYPTGVGTRTYTVTAIATDSAGNSGSGSTVIVVSDSGGGGGTTFPAPTANFTVSQSATPATTTTIFSFDGSLSTPANNINEYRWDFGDNSQELTGVRTSHRYAAAGTYPVTLTVTDNQNRTATATKNVVVQ